MPTSTDINLPKAKNAVFPDACVVCGADEPNNTINIDTSSVGWWTAITWWWGKRFSVHVPACKECAFRLQLRRWGALVVFLILAFVVLAIIAPLITPHVPASSRKWVMMIALLVCMSPFFVWETFFPPAFEMTAFSDTVDYEFRDEDYAIQFQLLNRFDLDVNESDDTAG